MGKLILGWLATALLASCAAFAADKSVDIEIGGAWARATVPGQQAASVDLTITSKRTAALVGASSPVAETVSIHSMTSEGGMMKMREVKSIALPAGKAVNLHDGGYHLMLDGLKAPLKEGESVPLTLSIQVGKQGVSKHETRAEVRPLHAASK